MAKYVLGEEGARKFKQLTKQVTGVKNRISLSPQHVIDNLYPHPYEVRWTESQISGGGYMIWLPPKCLQVDGTNISPEKWLPDSGKICADVSSDWWYRLKDKVAGLDSSVNVDELSSFNLYLNATMDEVIMSLSAEETWKGNNGFVHIAEIDNYRSKPNVKSNLILDNTRHRPFDLVEDPSYTGAVHQWIMRYCMFEDRGTTIALTDGFLVPAPSVTPETSSTFYGLRLVEVDNGDWLVDRVEMQNTSDFAALNALSIGEQLSQPVSSNEVVATYPLYIQSTTGGIIFDLRDAWYNIQGIDAADEKSVALTGDVLSNSLSSLSTEYHLHHFHDNENDYVISTLISGDTNPPQWNFDNLDMLIRQRNLATEHTEAFNELYYLDLRSLLDKIGGGGGGGGGSVDSDSVLSVLPVDEKSISKGDDGWALGGLSSLHMWHFHDQQADSAQWPGNDTFFVLRYGIGDNAQLKYTNMQAVANQLQPTINNAIQNAQISADQLSSVPSDGMFAWTPVGRRMAVGGCMVGRKWYTCTNGTGSGKADGLYQLHVTVDGGFVSLNVVSNASLGQSPTQTENWIPIYEIQDGKILHDYRGAFVVPAYD